MLRKVYIWERMKDDVHVAPCVLPGTPSSLPYSPQSLCFAWNIISLPCTLRTCQSFWKVTEYLLCTTHQGKEAEMDLWMTLNGIMGMLVPDWKSRWESGVLPRFSQVTEAFSMIATADQVHILNYPKSVTMWQDNSFPHTRLKQSKKMQPLFSSSITDLLLFWPFPPFPVTFAQG